MVRPGKERAADAEADGADASARDQHEAPETVPDTPWLNGINRQARQDAQQHQLAASRAAAEKRKAAVMSEEQRAAALLRYAAKRNEKKRQKRAAASAASAQEDVAAVVAAVVSDIVAEVAEACDEVDEEELEEELERRIIEQHGEPYLMDTSTRDAVELDLRMEGYGAARGDDGRQVYMLPHGELQRRVADGELPLPGEDQLAWDRRVLRDRLARDVPLGDYLEELQQLLRKPPHDPIADHELANYGAEASDWKPQSAEPTAPPPPPPPASAALAASFSPRSQPKPQLCSWEREFNSLSELTAPPPPPPPPPAPATLPPPPPADALCRCTTCGHILPIHGCDNGCACLYAGETEAFARHMADKCSPACTPRWSQALVNIMPRSVEPCTYCAKYAAGRCMGVDDFPEQETLQQQRRVELEAQQASAAPAPPPPPSGSSGLLQAFDEGDVPYFFEKGTARTLAAKSELLDASVSNPEWICDPSAEVSGAAELWPPERSDYDLGERGQRAYRRDRACWYHEHTGRELTGSIAEQNDQWDDYKRNFRARGDRDACTEPVSGLLSEPYVRDTNIRPMHHWYDW